MDPVNDALAGQPDHVRHAMAALTQDSTRLAQLAREGATDQDLADTFGVPVDAVTGMYDALLRKSRAQLRGRIRRGLLAAADRGDSRVLGYLAVKYLEPPPTDDEPQIATASIVEAKRLAHTCGELDG